MTQADSGQQDHFASRRPMERAFRAFLGAVLQQKHAVLAAGGTAEADVVQQRLLERYEAESAETLRRMGQQEVRAFSEVQYLMIAAADEAFLQIDWPGRAGWLARPLETHVWKSHEAGERVFRTLDEILERRVKWPTEVLLVYLHVLSIGFRGRFALLDPHEPENYRRRLVKHLRDLGEPLARSAAVLSPDALRHTVANHPRLRLPLLSRGTLPLAITIAVWVLLGGILFQSRTAVLREALDRIEAIK